MPQSQRATGKVGHLLPVGAKFPAFDVPDAAGAHHTLASFEGGRVAFFFVPFAFSQHCTAELHWLLENLDEFKTHQIEPVLVSCDARATLNAWLDETGLSQLTALSDFWPHGTLAESCGVFDSKNGYALRATFILEKDGHVLWSDVAPAHDVRHLDEFLFAIKTV